MNGEELLKEINDIDDNLIQEASINKKRKKKSTIIKWYGVAACLCLILIGALIFKGFNKDTLHENIKNPTDEIVTNNKVNIPEIKISKNSANSKGDMIGLIIYNNGIYTQSGLYGGDEAVPLRALVGEKLGYAKGNIDERSKRDEYNKELSSTVKGEVYAVNGYDKNFRICIKNSYIDEKGKEVENIGFYEKLNGIGLDTGKDLFGERLKIADNWDHALYLEHNHWNNGEKNYKELSKISKEDMGEFFKELYSSEFVNLTRSNIYDKESHHIYIHMKDKTIVELRLFEDGYVGYQPLGWYFVKMPGDIFNKIYKGTN